MIEVDEKQHYEYRLKACAWDALSTSVIVAAETDNDKYQRETAKKLQDLMDKHLELVGRQLSDPKGKAYGKTEKET